MREGAVLERALLFEEAWCREDRLPESRFAVELLGGLDVVQHSHPSKEPDVLKCAGDTEGGNLIRVLSGDVLITQADRSSGRWQKPGNHVEQRRLAGAIRPD